MQAQNAFFFFSRSIGQCPKRDKVQDRIRDLNHHFTSIIYQNITRSLFADHTLVFSFILCVGILRGRGEVSEAVWSFFLTGGLLGERTSSEESGPKESLQPNPAPEWLSEKSWSEVIRASTQLPSFQGLMEHLKMEPVSWREGMHNAPNPYSSELPGIWNGKK